MNFGGLIANSLVDYPGRPAVVAFTQGCNWHCPYCHNAGLISRSRPPSVSANEVLDRLTKRPSVARNLVITGGEPTQQSDLLDFLAEAANQDFRIKLDTNGSNPAMLKRIVERGLVDYVAIDVKGPLDQYDRFCGIQASSSVVRDSINFVMQSNIDHEFRTTVVPALHDRRDIVSLGPVLTGGKRLFLQPFRPGNTLRRSLATTPAPTIHFLKQCSHLLQPWIPTYLR